MSSSDQPHQDIYPQKVFKQSDSIKRLLGLPSEPEHLAGIKRLDSQAIHYTENVASWPKSEAGKIIPQINWGGQSIAATKANMHFLVAGVPGTGKTITFRALIQSIFNPQIRFHFGGNDRAIIYDPKQEFVPILDGLGIPLEEVAILNAFDRRTMCWNMSTDYNDSASASQLAKSLIPIGENLSQPFFAKASAAILAAVICEHIRSNPGGWDLADIILDCLSEEDLLTRLQKAEKSPYNIAALTSMARGDTRASVMAELTTALSDYLPIASRWRKAREHGRILSIKRFLDLPSGVLLLGANRQFSESLGVINRLFLRRFSELSLDNTDTNLWNSENRTWLFLDELKELGKVHDLATLISKGRGKGICAVLGFQDISGLEEAFGEKNAQEITACCHHKLFLKLSGQSAEWASKSIGQTEVLDTSVSVRSGSSLSAGFNSSDTSTKGWTQTTFGLLGTPLGTINTSKSIQSGTSFTTTLTSDVTVSKQSKVKDAVLPSEISGLPDFSRGGGITGFSFDYCDVAKESIVKKMHVKIDEFSFLRNSSDAQGFVPWNPSELDW
jgi:type IV secretory pathway TraG/TraD family ATPase VirD4